MVITAVTCIGSTWAVTKFSLPCYSTSFVIETTTVKTQLENKTRDMDATCRSDFKNGTFHLGDIQFQTIIAKSYKSPYQKIVLEEYKNWEEQCKDLK